jgi:hypothetical protein
MIRNEYAMGERALIYLYQLEPPESESKAVGAT